jgi:hypothetical protein
MKSGIKITGLIKSGGQQIVIEKRGKMAAEEVLEGNVKLQNVYANAQSLSNIILFSLLM